MSKYFRPWNIDQTLFLPPSVQDFVPKGHVSRFIVQGDEVRLTAFLA